MQLYTRIHNLYFSVYAVFSCVCVPTRKFNTCTIIVYIVLTRTVIISRAQISLETIMIVARAYMYFGPADKNVKDEWGS